MKQDVTNYIQQAVLQGLIRFYDDDKRIEYIHQKKSRNYTNPEEQVQAETYCRLILEYGYPAQRVLNFVSVTMGADKKPEGVDYNADISITDQD